jgi:transporter family-2 protein
MGAVFVSLVTSTLVVGVAVLATGSGSRLGEVIRVSPVYLTGGLIGAVYLAIALFAVGSLGAGGVVAATVTTQLVCAALLDRLGVLGLSQVGLTPTRLLGFGLLLAGTALITLR